MAIRINQNPFSAQYDQVGYGRIEVITKPGTSAFHGSASGQFQDKVLNTQSPFITTQPDYHTIFFLGNITGPIRNGMSFTLSGSRRDIANNSITNPAEFYSTSPTSTTLCMPGPTVVNGQNTFPCSTNPFPIAARAFSSPSTRWDVSPRVDMMLGAKNTMTTRYEYETGYNSTIPSVSTALQAPSNGSSSEQTIQISDTQLISSKVINESRFEYQHDASNSITPGTSPGISVSGGGFSVPSGGQSNSTSNHYEVQNYTSIQLIKNFIRLGGRLRSSSETNFSNGGTYGSFNYTYLLDPCTDPSVTTRPSNCASSANPPCSTSNMVIIPASGSTPAAPAPLSPSYQCGVLNGFGYTDYINPTISARETDLGFYAEDDWKVTPNLTWSYGVRLETQNVINSNHDIAPRMSIAYGIPRKNGKRSRCCGAASGLLQPLWPG